MYNLKHSILETIILKNNNVLPSEQTYCVGVHFKIVTFANFLKTILFDNLKRGDCNIFNGMGIAVIGSIF